MDSRTSSVRNAEAPSTTTRCADFTPQQVSPTSPPATSNTVPCVALYNVLVAAAQHRSSEDDQANVDAIASALQSAFPYNIQMLRCQGAHHTSENDRSAQDASDSQRGIIPTQSLPPPKTTTPSASSSSKTYVTVKQPPAFCRRSPASGMSATTAAGTPAPTLMVPIDAKLPTHGTPEEAAASREAALTTKAVADLVAVLQTFEAFLRVCVEDTFHQEPERVLGASDEDNDDIEVNDSHRAEPSRDASVSTDMDIFGGERVRIETANSGRQALRGLRQVSNGHSARRSQRRSSTLVHADESTSSRPRMSPSPQSVSGRGGTTTTAGTLSPSVVTATVPTPVSTRHTRFQDTPDSIHLSTSKSGPTAPYTALGLSGAGAGADTWRSAQRTTGGGGPSRESSTGAVSNVNTGTGGASPHWSRVLAIVGLFTEYLYQTLFVTPGGGAGEAKDGAYDEDDGADASRESLVERQRRAAMAVSGPLAAVHEAFLRFVRDRVLESIFASNNASGRARRAQIASDAGLSSATMRSASPSLTSRAAALSLSTSHRGPGLLSPMFISPRSEIHGVSTANPATCVPPLGSAISGVTPTSPQGQGEASVTVHTESVSSAGDRAPPAVGSISAEEDAVTAARVGAEEAAAEREDTIRRSLLSWWIWLFGASGLAEATLLLLHRPSPLAVTTTTTTNAPPSVPAHTPSFDFLIGSADFLARQYVLDHNGHLNSGRNSAKLAIFASAAGLPQELIGRLEHAMDQTLGSADSLRSPGPQAEPGEDTHPHPLASSDAHNTTPSLVSADPTVVKGGGCVKNGGVTGLPFATTLNDMTTSNHCLSELTEEEQATQRRIERILGVHQNAPAAGEEERAIHGRRADALGMEGEDDITTAMGLSAALQGPHNWTRPGHHQSALRRGLLSPRDATTSHALPEPHRHNLRTGLAMSGATEVVSTHTNHLINVFLHRMRDNRAREALLVYSDDESDENDEMLSSDALNASAPVDDAAAVKPTSSSIAAPSTISRLAPMPDVSMYAQFQRIQHDTAMARHALQFATRLGSVYGTQDMNALLPLLPSMLQQTERDTTTSNHGSQHNSPHFVEVAPTTRSHDDRSSPRHQHFLTVHNSTHGACPAYRSSPPLLMQTRLPADAHAAAHTSATAPHTHIKAYLAAYWAKFATSRPRYLARTTQKSDHSWRLHTVPAASALRHETLIATMLLHHERVFATLHSPSSFSMDAEESTELALSLVLTLLQGILKAWKALNEGSEVSVTQRYASAVRTGPHDTDVSSNNAATVLKPAAASSSDIASFDTKAAEPLLQSTVTMHTRVSALFGYSDATWSSVADALTEDVHFAVVTALARGQALLSVSALEVGSILDTERYSRRRQQQDIRSRVTAAADPPSTKATITSDVPKATLSRAPATRQAFPLLWLANFAQVADTTRHLLGAGHRSPKPLEVSTWYLAGLAEYYVRLRRHVLHTSHVLPRVEAGTSSAASAARVVAVLQSVLTPNAAHANALSLYDRAVLLAHLREAQGRLNKAQAETRAETTAATAADKTTTSHSTWMAFWGQQYTAMSSAAHPNSPAAPRTLADASKLYIEEELVAPAEQFFGVLTGFLETIASSYLSLTDELRHVEGNHGNDSRFATVDSLSDEDENDDDEESTSQSDCTAARYVDNNNASDPDSEWRVRDDLNSSLRAVRYGGGAGAGGEAEEYGSTNDIASLLAARRIHRHRAHPSRLRGRHESVSADALRDQQRWMEMCVHYFLEVFDVLLDVSIALDKRPLFLYALTVGLDTPRRSSATHAPVSTSVSASTPPALAGAPTPSPTRVLRGTGHKDDIHNDVSENAGTDDGVEEDVDGYIASRSPVQQFLTLYSSQIIQRSVNRLHGRKAFLLPPWLSQTLLQSTIAPSIATSLGALSAANTAATTPTGSDLVAQEGSPASSTGWEISTMCWPDDGLKSWCRYLRVMQHSELVARFLVDVDVHALTVIPSRAIKEKSKQLRAVTAHSHCGSLGSEVLISGISALLDAAQGPCAQLLSVSCTRPKPVYLSPSGAYLGEFAQAARGIAGVSDSHIRLQSLVQAEESTTTLIANYTQQITSSSASGALPAIGTVSSCSKLWMRLHSLRLLRAAATPLDQSQLWHFCSSLLLFSPSAQTRAMRRHFRELALELLQRRTILKSSQSSLYARLLLLRTVQALVSSCRSPNVSRPSGAGHNTVNGHAPSPWSADARSTSMREESAASAAVEDSSTRSLNATLNAARGTPMGQSLQKLGSMHSQQSSSSTGDPAVVPYATTLSLWDAYTSDLLRTLRELCWYHADAHLEANKLGAPSVLAQFLSSLTPTGEDDDNDDTCNAEGYRVSDEEPLVSAQDTWMAADTPRTHNTSFDLDQNTQDNSAMTGGMATAGAGTRGNQPTDAHRAAPAFVISSDVVPADFVDFEDYADDESDDASAHEARAAESAKTEAAIDTRTAAGANCRGSLGEGEDSRPSREPIIDTRQSACAEAIRCDVPPVVPTPSSASAIPVLSPTASTGLALPKLSFSGLGPALYYASSGDTGAAQEAALLFNTTAAAATADMNKSRTAQPADGTGGDAHEREVGAGHHREGGSATGNSSNRAQWQGEPRRTTSSRPSSPTHADETSSPLGASLTLTASPPGSALTTSRLGGSCAENDANTCPASSVSPSMPAAPGDFHATAQDPVPSPVTVPAAAAAVPFKMPALSLGSLGPPLYFLSSGDTGMAQSEATTCVGRAAYGATASPTPKADRTAPNTAPTGLPPVIHSSGPHALPPMAPMPNVGSASTTNASTTMATTTTTHTATNQQSPPHAGLPRSSGGRPPLPIPATGLRPSQSAAMAQTSPLALDVQAAALSADQDDRHEEDVNEAVQPVPKLIVTPATDAHTTVTSEAERSAPRSSHKHERLAAATPVAPKGRGTTFGRCRSSIGQSASLSVTSSLGPVRGRSAASRGSGGGKPEHTGVRQRRHSISSAGLSSTAASSSAGAPLSVKPPSIPVQKVQRVVPTLRRQDSLRRQASLSTELMATAAPTSVPAASEVDTGSGARVPLARMRLAVPTPSAANANHTSPNDSTHAANTSLPFSMSPNDSHTACAMGSPSFSTLALTGVTGTASSLATILGTNTTTAAAVAAAADRKNKSQRTPSSPTLGKYALSPAVTAELILNICSLIIQRRGGMISYGFTVSALMQRKLPATYAIQPRVLTSLISHAAGGDHHKASASGERASRRLGAAQLTPAPQGPSSYHVLRSLRQYLHTHSKVQRTVSELLRQWLVAQFGPTAERLWRETSSATRASSKDARENACYGSDDYGSQPLAVGLGVLLWLLLPDRTLLTSLEVHRRLGTGGYGSVMAAHYQPTRRPPSTSVTTATPSPAPCPSSCSSTAATEHAHAHKGSRVATFRELARRTFAETPNIALKMLPLSLQGSEGGMLPTVHAEVLNMLRLRGHPHVVEVLSFGCTEDEYFLAMPHYEAGSVQRWRVTKYPPGCAPLMEKPTSLEDAADEGQRRGLTKRAPALSVQQPFSAAPAGDALDDATENQLFLQCADVFTQVLEAVAFMHQRNIRHGDIKADNIFVADVTASDGSARARLHVRVGDFGSSDTCDEDDLRALARDVESGESRFLAGRWGSGRGTEAIQPPEMLFPKRRYQVLNAVLDDVYARYEAEEASIQQQQQQPLHDELAGLNTDVLPVTMASLSTPTTTVPATSTAGATGSFLSGRPRSQASLSEAVFVAAREQLRRAELAVDMWACGCLLYELLTGRMLFGGARVGRAFVLATTAMKEQHCLDTEDSGATAKADDPPLPTLQQTATQRTARGEAADSRTGAVKTLDEWERRDLRLAVGEPVERFMSSLLNLNPLERPTATEALYRWRELLAQRRNVLDL